MALGGGRGGAAVWLLAALWLVILFDLQWLLASRGLRVAARLPVLLFPALALTLALTVPTVKEWSRRWTWYAPLAAFIATIVVMVPFAPNRGLAWDGLKVALLYWTLVMGTTALVSTARRAELLLAVFALQFLWWGLWGFSTGLVPWSPVLANYDGYGAYMVLGGGLCSFLLLATDKHDESRKWFRRAMMVTVGLCAIGMVASFARGAFLSALVVAAVVWLRSPHKFRTLAAGIACVGVVAAAAAILFGDQYWAEMSTILQGTEETTGDDRWQMWKAAWGVFLAQPILGVGYDNWGVFAASYYRPGDLGGVYGGNPTMLWGRQAHNSYVTILAEQGIVGSLAFLWVLGDFFRRNARLRAEAAGRTWTEIGGRFRLSAVALGLEAAMIAWMGAAALYSMAGTHWLYTLLALNLTLHRLVDIERRDRAARHPRRSPGRPVGVRRPSAARAGGAPAGSESFPARGA